MPITHDTRYGVWRELREWRNAKGFSVAALSREARISKSYLSDLENGHKKPSPAIVAKLGVALNLPVAMIERRAS